MATVTEKAPSTTRFKSFKAADEKAPGATAPNPVVKPIILSHGTLGVIDLSESKVACRQPEPLPAYPSVNHR